MLFCRVLLYGPIEKVGENFGNNFGNKFGNNFGNNFGHSFQNNFGENFTRAVASIGPPRVSRVWHTLFLQAPSNIIRHSKLISPLGSQYQIPSRPLIPRGTTPTECLPWRREFYEGWPTVQGWGNSERHCSSPVIADVLMRSALEHPPDLRYDPIECGT